jgi:agarase
MDESGRNAWIGADGERLSTARPVVKEDLDAFLGILAERYYQVTAGAVRAATPQHLVITSANNHGGLIRRPILRAAGKYCDLIELTLTAQLPEVARITYEESRRPLVGFVLKTANKDSYFSSRPRLTVFDFPTQEKRAEAYRETLDFLYAFQASDGMHPVVGIELWDYIDKWAEQANSGLVTARDNAYDGKEDVVAAGADAWGYPTGGEERNYGDFITGVREANTAVLDRLKQELSRRGARA